MKRKNFQIKSTLFFKRWQRKSYSVFNTLGKCIQIGALSFTYSLVMISTPNYAQTDSSEVFKTLDMDEIIVSAQRSPVVYSRLSRIVNIISEDDLTLSPVSSLQEALGNTPGIDIRERGQMGVQADMSIRGGTFDQNLILLNGIDVTDPQTGHFALNIPVNLSDVKKIEVLKGSGSRVFGPNAFKGAVNIITQPLDTNEIELSLLTGEHGLYEAGINTNFKHNNFKHFVSLSQRGSDGYIENTDFSLSNLFYHGVFGFDSGEMNMQAGYQNKAYGAQSFYTPEYPYQFEENEIKFASLSASIGKKFKVEPSVYWRRHNDRFELFRESPEWYKREGGYFVKGGKDTAKYTPGVYEPWNYYGGHNYHTTDVWGGGLNLSYRSILGKTAIGMEFRQEDILSNVLGEPMDNNQEMKGDPNGVYDKKYTRKRGDIYLEHRYHLSDFTVSAGILGSVTDEYEGGMKFYPGIDISYEFKHRYSMYASYNQSLRLPTFTDMFYNGPANEGNPNLSPEKISSYEVGWKYTDKGFSAYSSLFYSKADDIIAWVLLDEQSNNEKWVSRNLTEVLNRGIEIKLQKHFDIPVIERATVQYTYLDQNKLTDGFQSKYSLSYLKHKLDIDVNCSLSDSWYLSLQSNYKDRNGSFRYYDKEEKTYKGDRSYNPYWIFNSKVHWRNDAWTVFLSVNNIFDIDYFSYGNITAPGRWVKGGIKKTINL
ncbi:MAG: TonB-dependent receptor [Bacteroidales bacterium]